MGKPVSVRRHAILKRQYHRVFAKTPDFQTLTPSGQWALLRDQVQAEAPDGRSALLAVLDSREPRRDEVLAALEEGRLGDL